MKYIVKKGSPKTWATAYEVNDDTDPTTLGINKAGGGFHLRVPRDSAEFVTAEELTKYYTTDFQIEDDEDSRISGWTDGHRWNGWAKPLVNRTTAEKVVKWWTDGGGDSFKIWFEGDRLWMQSMYDGKPEDEPSACGPEGIMIPTDDGDEEQIEVYDVSFGLIWSEEKADADWCERCGDPAESLELVILADGSPENTCRGCAEKEATR
jgi:hypothetical protein